MVDKIKTLEKNVQYKGDKGIKIFVYGTFLKGYSEHEKYLSEAKFAGNFIAEGFQLYDFGGNDQVVYKEINTVNGEIYIIDIDTLNKLDTLEVKGNLFIRKLISVVNDNGDVQEAYTYVYNKDLSKKVEASYNSKPNSSVKRNDYVWYASYGSNMLFDRLSSYIKGGVSKFNGVNYDGCRNTLLPKDSRPVTIPYKMYYGNESSAWEHGAVAFLDTQIKGESLGKMYLVTEEQFKDIVSQEGNDKSWYNQVISLGEHNGIEIVAVTNKNKVSSHNPSDKYIEVIKMGIKETYPDMSEFEVMKYLVQCGL